ncbi:MAG: hypothetical protein ACI8Z9_001202 [Paraglaciecola sp.]|jgi:hypothetical protein
MERRNNVHKFKLTFKQAHYSHTVTQVNYYYYNNESNKAHCINELA